MTVTHDHTRATSTPDAAAPAVAGPAPAAPVPLTVGAADDHAEERADALADTVLTRLAGAREAQGEDGPHAHDAGCGHLRRHATPMSGAAVGRAGGDLDTATTSRIESRRGAGRALDAPVRRDLEGAFGTSLGHVRIHDDATARSLARGMSATAFTTGNDVFLGDVDTSSAEGTRVLAHEIAHVVQETGSGVRRIFGTLKSAIFGPKDPAKEAAKADLEAGKKGKKNEDAKLKQQRETNTAARASAVTDIYGAPGTTSDLGAAQSKVTDINKEFAEALAAESDLASSKADAGMSAAEAAQSAYDETWLPGGTHEHLGPWAPARGTESERLMSLIRKARAHATAASNATDDAGGLLERDVEAVYVRAAKAAVEEARQAQRAQGSSVAAQAAARASGAAPTAPPGGGAAPVDVGARASTLIEAEWAQAAEKLRRKRPTPGSTLDLEMRRRAIVRAERETPEPEANPLLTAGRVESGFDTATEGLETVAGLSGMTDRSKSAGERALAQTPLGAGELVDAIADVKKRKKDGLRTDKQFEDAKDDPSKQEAATEVFGDALSIVTHLKSAVVNLKKLVASARTMHTEGVNTGEMLTSVKSGADALGALSSTATSTAKFAAGVADKVGDNVAKVVPGLNIVTTVFGVVSAVTDVVASSRAFNTTKGNLTQAYVRGKDNNGADVMVRPLLRVAQSTTINLEKASWSAGKAVGDLGVAIATVATAGGFGIPAAVGVGMSVVDALHDVGHMIANEVLRGLERSALREETGRLEGSAEKLLERSPATAVDGIIVRAAGGDAIALSFLSGFSVDDTPVDAAMLAGVSTSDLDDGSGDDTLVKVRDAVLDELGEDGNPAHIFNRYASTVKEAGGSVLDRFRDTGRMASSKNAMDRDTAAQGGPEGKNRGLMWRFGQMFARSETHERRMERTDLRREEHRSGWVGPTEIPAGASAATVLAVLENSTDGELKHALNDPRNPATVREAVLLFLAEKAKTAATAGGTP
ncbi:eCIS core domain-containing protein [Sanguibacter sp. A247]|uniref:eCIS core domain-containing protein n=1 Tax=unclassified Sanguibacter TaxID=2645534 RepID=UPI003FD800A5